MESRIARSVSATQLVRDLAGIRALAIEGPVAITSHNRTELVLLSAQRFAEMAADGPEADARVLDAKLTTLLDSLDTHVAILERDLRIRRINRAMRLVFELEGEATRGLPIGNVFPAENAPFLVKRLREVVASGKIAEFDFASAVRPGRTIHARMVPWAGGVVYLGDDVTDRMAGIERDLELSAVRAALTTLGDHGSGSIDEKGTILAADAGFGRLIGAEVEQIAGRRFVSLFDPAQRAQLEKAIGTFGKSRIVEVGYLRNGVSIGQARLVLAPFFSGAGHPRHAFVIEDRAFDR